MKFVNLSISSLGVSDKERLSFLEMLGTFGLGKNHQKYRVKKLCLLSLEQHII